MNEVYVYAGWLNGALIGTIHVLRRNGRETTGFEYASTWSQDPWLFLDPDLLPASGRQYPPEGKGMFGMFSNVCPDRWGRGLLRRREEVLACREGRSPRRLYEIDYLTGVSDFCRAGGLRFKLSPDGDFIAASQARDVPPITGLRRLEQAAWNYGFSSGPDETQWLNQLLSPGSSLGGARPKANVQDAEGGLWIAKFPSPNDERDMGAWEYVAHELAALCGLRLPEARIQTFSRYGSTFMVKRFDRAGTRRVHFASAMTMLGMTDGGSEESSYLDIAEFLASHGQSPAKDLEELFRRIAFSVAISNHDDHLRNHGFLLGERGWMLSPAYDLNPSPENLQYLSLNVTQDSRESSFELLQETAGFYQLSDARAREVIEGIRNAVRENWERLAEQNGIPRTQIRMMQPCFEKC